LSILYTIIDHNHQNFFPIEKNQNKIHLIYKNY